jgi:REP element-mobilizing transposase RayT
MPRKPRIDMAGYYHIINRGVEQCVVFKEAEDYAYFEELLCFHAKSYSITIHNYCLMSNYYHLFIEKHQENLSKFIRQLNANYAIYFNKKYRRSGHLKYLVKYIKFNPFRASMTETLS